MAGDQQGCQNGSENCWDSAEQQVLSAGLLEPSRTAAEGDAFSAVPKGVRRI